LTKRLFILSSAGKSLIAFSAIFVAGFASTIGPVAWVVAAEIFPQRLAAKCVTLATAANWGTNTVISEFRARPVDLELSGR